MGARAILSGTGLVLGLVGFGLGLGIGWMLGTGPDAPSRPTDPLVGTSEATYAEEGSGAAPPTPPPPPARSEPGASGVERAALTAAGGATAVAEAPPSPQGGEGRITGTVRTEDGKPLAGVLVRATGTPRRDPRASRWDEFEEPDLERQIEDLVQAHRWRAATRREATTGADGTYALTGLADASYMVQARHQGFEMRPLQRNGGIEPGASVDFAAAEVVEVPVLVLLPDGATAPQASVEFAADGEGRSGLHWTPQRPNLRVRPGTYRVVAVSGDSQDLRATADPVTVEAGVETPTLTLRLESRRGVRGKIQVEDGQSPDNVTVYLLRLFPGRPADPERLARDGRTAWAHRFSGLAYSFFEVEPGTYLIGAGLEHRGAVAASETIEVADGIVERDLVLPNPRSDEYVVLHVFDPAGSPLRDVQISTESRTRRGSSSSGASSIARSDGSFLVMHPAHDAPHDPEARYLLRVRSKRYGEREVEYVRGEVSEVTVRFEAPATLEVTLSGYVGSGMEGSLQLALLSEEGDRGRRMRHFFGGGEEPRLDEEGRQTLGPVQPGRYAVTLSTRESRFQSRTLGSHPATLAPGENRITIPIPPLYRLVVLVEDPSPGCRLQMERRSGTTEMWSAGVPVPEDGRVEFDRLPAGEYEVRLTGAGDGGAMSVTVPGPESVAFRPSPMDALVVRITDPESYLTSAGFEDGDRIVAVDGVDFGRLQIAGLRLRARMRRLGEAMPVRVLREGVALEIVVERARFASWDISALGGSLQPAIR